MRFYFQHARRIFQSAQQALEWADEQKKTSLLRSLLDRKNKGANGGEFQVSRERVSIAGTRGQDRLARADPAAIYIHRPPGISAELGKPACFARGDRRHRPAFRRGPAGLAALGSSCFRRTHAALALGQMHETGILAVALPVWRSIDSLVVRDFYHRYTVDEHTLVAIQAIDNLLQDTSGPASSAFINSP